MILAVDPGEHAGWCVVDASGEYLSSGAATVKSPVDVREALADVRGRLGGALPSRLVVEDQYAGRGFAWKSVRTLIRRAAWWEAAWVLSIASAVPSSVGVEAAPPAPPEAERVMAVSWQSKMLVGGGSKEARLAAAARRLSGKVIRGEDEQSAVCLAVYAARVGQIRSEVADRIRPGRRRSESR